MATINHDLIKDIELAVSLNWALILTDHCTMMKENFSDLIEPIGTGEDGVINILCESANPPTSTIEAPDAYIRGIRINQAAQTKPSTNFEAVFYDSDNRKLLKYFMAWKNNAIKMKNQATASKAAYSLQKGGLLLNQLSGIENAQGNKNVVGVYKPDMVYPTEVKESEMNSDNQYVKVTVTFTYSIFEYE